MKLDYPLEVCLDGIKERRGKARSDIPWIESENEEDAEFIEFIENYNSQSRPQHPVLPQGTVKEASWNHFPLILPEDICTAFQDSVFRSRFYDITLFPNIQKHWINQCLHFS